MQCIVSNVLLHACALISKTLSFRHKKTASFLLIGTSMPLQDKQLADDAHWCREYAKINAVALRKILEQHDKLLHNSNGQHLLQVRLNWHCPWPERLSDQSAVVHGFVLTP